MHALILRAGPPRMVRPMYHLVVPGGISPISSHNEAFLDTFHNTMKEVIQGYPVGQVGPAYYNIPDPSTQGTNQVGTSHQEAAPASSGDVQTV